MTPALDRELRTASRRAGTWRSRVFSGIAAMAIVTFAFYYVSTRRMVGLGPVGFASGPQIIAFLTAIGYGAIVSLAPLLTADTISRERREGTLPLLFLTPLTPKNIIFAKAMGGVIQGVTILAAVVPVTMIAVLSGGVGPYDIVRLVGIWFSGLIIALCSGIAVSVSVRDRAPAVLLSIGVSLSLGFFGAAIYFTSRLLAGIVETHLANGQNAINALFNHSPPSSVGVIGALAFLVFALLYQIKRRGTAMNARSLFLFAFCALIPFFILNQQFDILAIGSDRIQNVLAAINEQTGFLGFRQTYGTIGPANSRAAIAAIIFIVAASSFASIALAYAEWRVALALADAEPGRLAKAGKLLTETKLVRERPLFRRPRANPIVWLTSRTWRMRVAKWVYVGVAMIGVALALSDVGHYLFTSIPNIIVVATAIVASTAFRGEVNSGTLELILVTPIREADLIIGRFRAVFMQTILVILLLVFLHAETAQYTSWFMIDYSWNGDDRADLFEVIAQWLPTNYFHFPTLAFLWVWLGQVALTIATCFALSFSGRSPALTTGLSLGVTFIAAPLASLILASPFVYQTLWAPTVVRDAYEPWLHWARMEIPIALLAIGILYKKIRNREFSQ